MRLWSRAVKGRFHEPELMGRMEAWVDSLEKSVQIWVCLLHEHLDRSNLLRVRYSPSASELSALDTTCRIFGEEVHAQANRPDALLLVDNDIGLLESASQLLATQTKVNCDYKPAILHLTDEGLWRTAPLQNKRQVLPCRRDCFFVLHLMVKTILRLLHEGVQHLVRPAECFVCET